MKYLILASFVVIAAASARGDIFKCIDADGHATYQATSCPAGSHAAPIDQRYSSVLPMALPDSEKHALAARQARQARAHAERTRRTRNALKALKSKAQRCKVLKARYFEMQNHNLRHASSSTDMDLVRRMTRACSS